MGDYFIYIVVGAFFAGFVVCILAFTTSKNNKGAWDEDSKLKAQMRSRRWKVKDTAADIRAHLIRQDVPDTLWPVAHGAPGVQAITHERQDPLWRAVTYVRPSVGSTLLFTYELPQRLDGSLAHMPETYVPVSDIASVDSPVVDDDVRGFMSHFELPEAYYFVGPYLTFIVPVELGDPNVITLLETLIERAQMLGRLIPTSVWE